jgi:hypothetical protein
METRKFLTLLGLELEPLDRPTHSQSLSWFLGGDDKENRCALSYSINPETFNMKATV